MSVRIQKIVVEDLLSREGWFDLGTQKYRLLKGFNENGYPVIMVVFSNPIPQEDHEKLEKMLGVKFESYLEKGFFNPRELLRWTPDEDQIGFVMEYIYEYGWGLENTSPRPALKDVGACCPRCADRNRNGQSVSNECKYCADVPEWALKLEELGLARMVLTDSGWKWEI